jgi:N-methylhydantoinase A
VAAKKLVAAGIGEADMVFEYYVSARYLDQVYELEVPLPDARLSADGLERLIAAFHALHERRYTYRDEDSYQEYTDWRVIARGLRPKVTLREQADRGTDATPAVSGLRAAYFAETAGFTETPVYSGKALGHGMQVAGPAIIEEATSTLVVIPGTSVTVTQWGDYLMELGDTNMETGVRRSGGGRYS